MNQLFVCKASWTYDGNGINLLKNSDEGDLSNYIANGEWTLDNLLVERNIRIYSCCPVPLVLKLSI
jgi:nicotinic acetylcholine receptor alpha-7